MMTATPVFIACGDDDDDDVPESPAPTPPEEEKPQTIDGFEFVDLGLSVKWAVCNVGAKTPLESGSYFQYGNPNASNIKTNANDLPTYNISGTKLDPVTANMSAKWHMPSYDDFYELSKKCTLRLITTEAGFRHVLVQGPNGKTMQFPLAGVYPYDNKQLSYDNFQAWLLTSTLDNSGNPRPYAFKVRYTNETTGPEMRMDTDELIRLSRVNVRGVSTAAPDGEQPSQPSDETVYTTCPDSNHPHLIDLGLPSGTIWSCCNVGAKAPEQIGLYYAWGETDGYESPSDSRSFNWANYKWNDKNTNALSKYCTDSSFGTVDYKIVLDAEDDAAHVHWGNSWCTPNSEHCEELILCTTSEWQTVNGVKGRVVKGMNGGSIFLPAGGRLNGSMLQSLDIYGDYWLSTLNKTSSYYAHSLVFTEENPIWDQSILRSYGYNIRPVKNTGNHNLKGTLSNPYSATEAIEYAKSVGSKGTSNKAVFIKGKVSSISYNYGEVSGGHAIFCISDDGSTNNEFTCYRAYYLGNQKYTEGATLNVGDNVVVCGLVFHYRSSIPETKEYKAYLYSLNGVTK